MKDKRSVSQPPNDELAQEIDDEENIWQSDALLGEFVAHYPVNRVRLSITGAILYAVPVLFLQAFFFTIEDVSASIFIVMAYAIIGLAVAWYLAHNWNREVVLYSQGFSYREGGYTGMFLYAQIVTANQRAERVRILGFITRNIYEYTFVTDEDETLMLNQRYQNILRLGDSLMQRIIQARLPIVQERQLRGETQFFGAMQINKEGIRNDSGFMTWEDFTGLKVAGGKIILQSTTGATLENAIQDIDNAMLFVAYLGNVKKH